MPAENPNMIWAIPDDMRVLLRDLARFTERLVWYDGEAVLPAEPPCPCGPCVAKRSNDEEHVER